MQLTSSTYLRESQCVPLLKPKFSSMKTFLWLGIENTITINSTGLKVENKIARINSRRSEDYAGNAKK